jgi:arginine repressor
MKAMLTMGGITTMVSNEEYEFIESIENSVLKDNLTERQAEVARMLTSRGVLQRFKNDNNKIYYTRAHNQGIN